MTDYCIDNMDSVNSSSTPKDTIVYLSYIQLRLFLSKRRFKRSTGDSGYSSNYLFSALLSSKYGITLILSTLLSSKYGLTLSLFTLLSSKYGLFVCNYGLSSHLSCKFARSIPLKSTRSPSQTNILLTIDLAIMPSKPSYSTSYLISPHFKPSPYPTPLQLHTFPLSIPPQKSIRSPFPLLPLYERINALSLICLSLLIVDLLLY